MSVQQFADMTEPKIIPSRNLGLIPETNSTLTHANPLKQGFMEGVEADSTLVAWAGWFDEAADAEAGVFQSDFRLWNEGLGLLKQSLDEVVPALNELKTRLMLRPGLGLVLSDPHSVAALLDKLGSDRIEILVDPVAMLTPEMASDAGDHLPRFFHKLGSLDACTGVVLAGSAQVSDDRQTHRPIDWAKTFDQTLISCWRDSAFADRDVYLTNEACRAHIA
jgi:hypothetical protein